MPAACPSALDAARLTITCCFACNNAAMNTKTPLEIKLSAALPVALAGRADEVRTFKGTANSGKPFGYGGTQTVVDFEGLRHKASVPVLLEHSPVKMAGVCRLSVTADGLIAEGSLLSNEFGTQIAEAADQGFPWEMSVYVQTESRTRKRRASPSASR